jgi:superfamily II DNA or RNA helicase
MATRTGPLDADERAALTFTPTTLGRARAAPLRCFAPVAADRPGACVYAARFAARAPPDAPPDAPPLPNGDGAWALRATLRPEQADAVARVVDALAAHGSAMCSLPTGAGKTVVALAVAAALRTPALVLVHRAALRAQWLERIAAMADPAAFTVATIQTVARRGPLDAAFGLVVYDEAHHLSARTFCGAMLGVRTRYALALTATVERADGMHRATSRFYGEPVAVAAAPAADALVASVEPVALRDYGVRELTVHNAALGRRTVNAARLVSDLAACADRTAAVVARVRALAAAGRCALVLSHRREHCARIAAALAAPEAAGAAGAAEAGTVKCALLLGGTPFDRAAPFDAIVGTTAAASEGFDEPRLDTLVLATPHVAVAQAVGRILRRRNAHPPLVVDFVDPTPTCARQWRARHRAFRALGHAVAPLAGP